MKNIVVAYLHFFMYFKKNNNIFVDELQQQTAQMKNECFCILRNCLCIRLCLCMQLQAFTCVLCLLCLALVFCNISNQYLFMLCLNKFYSHHKCFCNQISYSIEMNLLLIDLRVLVINVIINNCIICRPVNFNFFLIYND